MREYHEIAMYRKDDSETAAWLRNRTPLLLRHHLWADNTYRPEVRVRMIYTGYVLCTHFQVFEENPTIRHHEWNSPVYKDSCVEFFLQPAPSTDKRYLNFEWNAAGVLLLGLGTGRHDRIRLTDVDKDLFGIETAIGRIEESTGRRYWELAFRIPFGFLAGWFPDFAPVPGSAMRGNFYKCGDDTPSPHYLSWSPVTSQTPDFHRSSDFGDLVFGSNPDIP